MSGFISSPIKMISMTNKQDFVVDPMYLLEAKATYCFNIQDFVDRIQVIAHELFIEPIAGVYRKSSHMPLFTAYDKLYTHKDTYAFFPEIAQPVVKITGNYRLAKIHKVKASALVKDTVGDQIDWRQAIENQINVYNQEGTLLLNAKDNRKNLLFNPGPSILSKRYVIDLIEYIIKTATHWGDGADVYKKLDEYLDPHFVNTVDVIDFGLKMCSELRDTVVELVSKNPWLIYSISNFGSIVMIDSSCDYRHYKCNELLWEQKNKRDFDSDLLDTYVDHGNNKLIKYEDLDQFFEFLSRETGFYVKELNDVSYLIEKTKEDRQLTGKIIASLTYYMQDKNGVKTRSTKLVNDLMGFNSGNTHFNFNEATGIYFL